MFDEREDNSMNDIEKICHFLKESGDEYFPSIRFRSKYMSLSRGGVLI